MQRIRFHLRLDAQDFLPYYSGEVKVISVLADDGRRIEFPAGQLRQFVQHEGIEGHFEIEFDDNNRMKGLRRL
jgi:hypothetical protein